MTRPLTSVLPLLALTVACAAVPGAADGALRETTYEVTVEARLGEDWQAETRSASECSSTPGTCTFLGTGSGRTRLVLRTPTPQRVSVMTGAPGMQPMITHAVDRGIPLKGGHKVLGTYTETYGGPWSAANPDTAIPDGGCGDRIVRTDIAFGWQGRGTLQPVLALPDRLDCPNGPYEGFDFAEAPDPGAVTGRVSESKFGRTKQFTVRGSRTWEGAYGPIVRNDPDSQYSKTGRKTVTFSWEATFRMVKPKRRKRR